MRYCCVSLIFILFAYVECEKLNGKTNNILTDIVETHSGPIRGITRKNVLTGEDYAAFLGIPYAEPPLRHLRFLPPFEIRPWTRPLNATKFGNICPQYCDNHFCGNEDCLFLNVYTPVINFKKPIRRLKAVMVWIHGGAFAMGSGNDDQYGPDYLIDKDVILVTFNYRLGPIGFMNLGHELIPGNAGLKDQNLVLQWVHKNIHKFGGDPNEVTLFGQSAGAVAVDLHNIAESSKSLYNRSIAISGSVFCPWAFMSTAKARKNGLRLARSLARCRICIRDLDEAVELLQNAPVQLLVENVGSVVIQLLRLELKFLPSVEIVQYENTAPFLNECYINKYERGEVHRGDHIIGFTSLEAGVVVDFLEDGLNRFRPQFFRRHKRTVNFIYNYIQNLSEVLFATGIDMKQKLMLTYDNPQSLYYYFFNYNSYKRNVNGVVHTEDLKYVFYEKQENPPLVHFSRNETEPNNVDPDAVTRNRVVTMYTNFAKFGKPMYRFFKKDDENNIEWKQSTRAGGYLEISDRLVMRENARPITPGVVDLENILYTEYKNDMCTPNFSRFLLIDSIFTL